MVDGELQSRNWKTEEGHTRSIVEIKARRIQFLNKRGRLDDVETGNDGKQVSTKPEDESPIIEDETFDKFLTNEESELLKQGSNQDKTNNG